MTRSINNEPFIYETGRAALEKVGRPLRELNTYETDATYDAVLEAVRKLRCGDPTDQHVIVRCSLKRRRLVSETAALLSTLPAKVSAPVTW